MHWSFHGRHGFYFKLSLYNTLVASLKTKFLLKKEINLKEFEFVISIGIIMISGEIEVINLFKGAL